MSEYLMGDSRDETERLRNQTAHDSVEDRLRWAGVGPGMKVVDAGCGPGDVSALLARLAGPSGSVHGFDSSAPRIAAARSLSAAPGTAPMSFEVGDISSLPYPASTADFVVCQYVLEHLPQPQKAVDAMVPLLKPGGKLLLMDCDGLGVGHWPAPPVVEEGLPVLLKALAKVGFDAFVGRKLYSMARTAGLRDLRVMTYAPMLAPGRVRDDEELAWRQRFKALDPIGPMAFGSAEAWSAFTTSYIAMLQDEASFKFVVGIAVRGTRP
jgi:SAM-dependent methyltransferase